MKNLNTKLDDILFKSQSEAQAILDQKDPGHEIAVTRSGYALIINPNREVVFAVASSTFRTN